MAVNLITYDSKSHNLRLQNLITYDCESHNLQEHKTSDVHPGCCGKNFQSKNETALWSVFSSKEDSQEKPNLMSFRLIEYRILSQMSKNRTTTHRNHIYIFTWLQMSFNMHTDVIISAFKL